MHTLALWGVDQQLWPYRGASRKRLLNYHSENDRKKEFMMFCHSCITLKQRFMVMDIGRRAKHTYKWCEGGHHPLHCPPPHSGSVVRATSEGPSVKGLQQQHSRCGHRFLWGAKWTIIPSNPSAAFPETEEFSLNPEEKYLYMRFYDLKSVLETDLCPLFGKVFSAKHCAAWLDSILYMQKDEWSTTVGFKVRHNPGIKRLTVSLQFLSFACIIHVTPTNYLGLAPSKCQNLVDLLDSIFPLTSCTVQCNQACIPKMCCHLFQFQNLGY